MPLAAAMFLTHRKQFAGLINVAAGFRPCVPEFVARQKVSIACMHAACAPPSKGTGVGVLHFRKQSCRDQQNNLLNRAREHSTTAASPWHNDLGLWALPSLCIQGRMECMSHGRSAPPPFLPWWDPEDSAERMHSDIERARQVLKGHPAIPSFRMRSLLVFVHMANKLEGTLPKGYNDLDTYNQLEQQLTGGGIRDWDHEDACTTLKTWPAEGCGSEEETRQQLLQFGLAAQYLCWPLRKPLTVGDIKTAHRIMMRGATEDGRLMAAGEFRTEAAHSGTGLAYPAASTIPSRLEHIVNDFNASLGSEQAPSFTLAADLLYQFVTLHPFSNGNGRMCRLLAAYAMLAAGEPFLINMHNRNSKAAQHYQQVLRHADKHGEDTGRLGSYLLQCLHLQWMNALAYCGGWGRGWQLTLPHSHGQPRPRS